MLNELLWFFNAKYQYEQQKRLGLAGFMGLLLAVLIIWKWNDWILPLATNLGLVALAERYGMISSDGGIYTALHMFAGIVALLLFAAMCVLVIGIFLLIFSTVGSTKIGSFLLFLPAILLFLPFALPQMIKTHREFKRNDPETNMVRFYKNNPNLLPLIQKRSDMERQQRNYELYLEQRSAANDPVVFFSYVKKELERLLNRAVASIQSDRDWSIGYCREKHQCVLLLPNPLPIFASRCAQYQAMRPYDTVYNFRSLDLERVCDSPESNYFHVPALPIEFIWSQEEERLVPALPSDAKMFLQNTVMLKESFACKHDDFRALQDEVSQRTDVAKWNTMAHVLLYFLPRVFPFELPTTKESVISKASKEILNADVFYPIYAADVEECESHFKAIGEDYKAIQARKLQHIRIN